MRSHSHLNTARKIIDTYDGSLPFAGWLKDFFKADKKFGSKDRKQIGHACYCYFRLGKSFKEVLFEERILIGLYLCSNSSNPTLQELRPEWNETVSLSLGEKIKQLGWGGEVEKIFLFTDELSQEIECKEFNQSLLIQPDLFLRIRPGKKAKVVRQLEGAGVDFSLAGEDCIRLSNQSKVDEILAIDEDVVVQDYNSQNTIDMLKSYVAADKAVFAWDCCAASGGKSILLHDRHSNSRLTVSDVRESILLNLRNRFRRGGINDYSSFVADISRPNSRIPKNMDVVICDAPCSGSGTWSRTPEQLRFFLREKIGYYAELQKRIVGNAVKAVKPGGYFLYITCSVFGKENEEVADFIEANYAVELLSKQYLKGYDKKADTLFTALFRS